MNSLDIDLDVQLKALELEWRLAYEASIAARADYQQLAAQRTISVDIIDAARDRLERAEALKERILVRIERLEDGLLRAG